MDLPFAKVRGDGNDESCFSKKSKAFRWNIKKNIWYKEDRNTIKMPPFREVFSLSFNSIIFVSSAWNVIFGSFFRTLFVGIKIHENSLILKK